MLINPQTAFENKWIVAPTWMNESQLGKCIQPNAIDITADKLFKVEPNEGAYLSETGKQFHNLVEVPVDEDGYWVLEAGQCYDMMSDFYVSVPEKVAGDLIIRSTLNRCGLALNSGLWDSGFKGNLGAIIYNRTTGQFRLMPHTRVCQIKFIMSDSSGMYAGGYNREQGQHWTTKPGSIYDLNAVAKMTGSSGPL